MGRRALRPIDPTLDLSRHLCPARSTAATARSAALFGRQAPLEIEVGSGKGLFLAAAAAGDPTTDFLGIEILAQIRPLRRRPAGRPEAGQRQGPARRRPAFFHSWLPDNSIAAVHVYFPDPWWKARHKKRRVMNERFLADVERTLLPGGTLHFWTDVEEYYQTTLELIAMHSKLIGPHPVGEVPADHDLDYRTHFERRMRLTTCRSIGPNSEAQIGVGQVKVCIE